MTKGCQPGSIRRSLRAAPPAGCWQGGTNPRLGPGRPHQLDGRRGLRGSGWTPDPTRLSWCLQHHHDGRAICSSGRLKLGAVGVISAERAAIGQRVDVGAKSLLRHARRCLDLQGPLSCNRLLGFQTLPDRALRDADDARERRLSARTADGLLECFKGRHRIKHAPINSCLLFLRNSDFK